MQPISTDPGLTEQRPSQLLGEGGITPALGVIVDAIVDALADLGVTHLEMSVTPERVCRAIGSKSSASAAARSSNPSCQYTRVLIFSFEC